MFGDAFEAGKSNHFHLSSFHRVSEHLPVNVGLLGFLYSVYHFACFSHGFGVAVRIGISEVKHILSTYFVFEVVKFMGPSQSWVSLFILVRNITNASLPLLVGQTPINWAQSCFKKLALQPHVSYRERKFFAFRHALDTKIKPSLEMWFFIWSTITRYN